MADQANVPITERKLFSALQLIVAYALIECALWSAHIASRNRWALVAAIAIFIFVLIDRPSPRRLGFTIPSTAGAITVFSISIATSIFLVTAVLRLGGDLDPSATLSNLYRSAGYLAWALLQEFLLQSFFFTRCEVLFGEGDAVWAAATLFAAAHLPSPVLTTFTLIAGLFFCEMFRLYRSIYPIALVHAVLGLTVAVTMPDNLLHHMRVGIGYLQY